MTVEFNSPANMLARVCLPLFGAPHASTSLAVDNLRVAGQVDGDYLCADDLGSGGHVVTMLR